MPLPNKSFADYDNGCKACEINVVLTAPIDVEIIRLCLYYDKRSDGSAGRALRNDLDQFNLKKGDRLEPSLELMDVSEFECIETFPKTVVFWRPSDETCAKHRNPIFNATLGTSPGMTLGQDWLHILSLGVFQDYAMGVVHDLVRANAWLLEETTAEAKIQVSARLLTSELKMWYKSECRNGRNPTNIGDITYKMLGTWDKPCLKLKGSETNHFVRFVVVALLPRHGHKLAPRLLGNYMNIGKAFVNMMDLIHAHPKKFPPIAIQALLFRGALLVRRWARRPWEGEGLGEGEGALQSCCFGVNKCNH